jgi:hypothetical protein
MHKMAAGWLGSAATFEKCTAEKLSFILLCLLDLGLTLLAINLGFSEINPLVGFMIQAPALLITIKLVIPVIIAWLAPGKLLWPSIILMTLVIIWNVKELAVALL